MVNSLKQKFLKRENINLYEAFSTSIVAGLAETYFVAFALHKGASVIESGLLASLPLIFASLTPFIFNRIFHKYLNSSWVQLATLIQAFSLLSLVGVGLIRDYEMFFVLLVIYSIYWFGHYSTLPSWNKWISELITHERSQKFFSERTRVTQVGVITGLLAGGMSLHLEVLEVPTYLIFIVLFFISFILKVVSFNLFKNLPASNTHYNLKIKSKLEFFKRNIKFFKVYSLFNCSLYLSAPYLSGYLLNIRGLDYMSYMFVMGGLFFGKIISSTVLNKIRTDIKPHSLFFWGGVVAAPLPLLWPLCPGPLWMTMVHTVSGIGWGAWDMGLSLMIFKHIKTDEKLEAVSMYNTIGLPMQVIGTVIGGLLLRFVYQYNYSMMFFVAGVVRFVLILPLKNRRLGH